MRSILQRHLLNMSVTGNWREAMPQQVWTADEAGGLDYVNQQVLDYSDYKIEDLLGAGWFVDCSRRRCGIQCGALAALSQKRNALRS